MDIYILSQKEPSRIVIPEFISGITKCIKNFVSTDIFHDLTHPGKNRKIKIDHICILHRGEALFRRIDFDLIRKDIEKQGLILCSPSVRYSFMEMEAGLPSGMLYFKYSSGYFSLFLGKFGKEHGVLEIHCNLDNVTPEKISTYQKALLKLNALDVWIEMVHMKKSRPAYKLCVLVPKLKSAYFQEWLLSNTPTLGIRYIACERLTLMRRQKGRTKIWYDLLGHRQEKKEHNVFEEKFFKQFYQGIFFL